MEKKAAYIIFFSFLLAGFGLQAQNPTYRQLASILADKLPSVDLSDKILAFQAWSSADALSRESNKEFERVSRIYHTAKLKNGAKGTVVISCSLDDQLLADIAFQKDGIEHLVSINKADYAFLAPVVAGSNVVYDSRSAQVYENLASDKIFISYNQLISR